MAEEGKTRKMRARLDRLMAEARSGRNHTTVSPFEEAKHAVANASAGSHTSDPEPEPDKRETPAPTPRAICYKRHRPQTRARPSCPQQVPLADKDETTIEQLTRGIEQTTAKQHRCWIIDADTETTPFGTQLLRRMRQKLRAPGTHLRERLQVVYQQEDLPKEPDLLFMDIESTGLSNSPLFLIGCMMLHGGKLMVRQLFARNYAEEQAVIHAFGTLLNTHPFLITFNGKSYDMPFIRVRATTHGVALPLPAAHFDLLHESRRLWKHNLPNCKLQTLETAICGHPPRVDDIPGSEIPEAYHAYVRTQDARAMATVLKHNLLDLTTLAELVTHL